ncbi:MAG TPA: tyrosine-type recombinase/integrase [Rhizomicrobium sp.]
MRLTDKTLNTLKAPDAGAVIYHDNLIPGFGVRVSEGGTKSFVLTHGPRRQRETLGRVGILGLSEARGEAKRRLAEYTLGRTQPLAISWNDALEEYLAQLKPTVRWRTHADYGYILKRHFRYGATRLSEVSPHEIQKTIDKLAATPAMQQRAFVVLRTFIHWAHRKHYFEQSPMVRMKAPHSYVPRERILTEDELRSVWNAAGDDDFGRIVKLLILTGQRRGEITGLTGAMVKADTITLPATLTKNGRAHTIPLGARAREILGHARKAHACYFPARGKETPFNGFSKSKPKLDKRCGVVDWTLHDLRRTFASGLASLRIGLPVIERLLNHVSGTFGGIVGVYQRYDFMPEMEEAIIKWEEYIARMVDN